MRRLRMTIAQRIWIGFGLLILAMLVYAFLANKALSKNQLLNRQVSENYSPSLSILSDLYKEVDISRMLIRSWVFIDKSPESKGRLELRLLHEQRIPGIDESIRRLMGNWKEDQKKKYEHIISLLNDSLILMHHEIMNQLPDAESYLNQVILYNLMLMVQEDGPIMKLSNQIMNEISSLIGEQEKLMNLANIRLNESFNEFRKMLLLMTIGLILVSVFIAVLIIGSLISPINYIKDTMVNMSKGILPEDEIPEGKGEIGQMSKALNDLVKGLKAISNFSLQIGKGNFESDFQPLSNNDILGNALINMREELKKAALDEEKRKKEDDQRNWATQGLARFGEILRQNNNSIDDLSYNILSNLVKYLEANQGGLFLINNSDPDKVFIEMTACYAYNRKKFLEKKIEPGEGLVGRCIQERGIIYLTDIPKDYIKITSGLGQDNPRSLLLVPLALNENVFGVIEIASFREFESYHIEFVEKLAASIASTINTVKTNMQTTMFLEQSRQQAEEMSAQEEEMRQNMEELRATQEQSARREELLEKQLAEVKAKLSGLQK